MNAAEPPASPGSEVPTAPVASNYGGYENWKGWTNFFSFDAADAEYFSGEMRGLPALAGNNVLEMGFGTGSFLAWAKAQGAIVTGTEVNERLCAEARKAGVALIEPRIETIAEQHRDHFDLIAAFDVFEHFDLEEIHARIRAVETMLKPGGHAILRFPNGQSPFGLVPQNWDTTHKTALSRYKLEQICRDTNFTTVRYAGSYRIRGRVGLKRIMRGFRGLAQDTIAAVLNVVYAYEIPWDAVVVIVLHKAKAAGVARSSTRLEGH